MTVWDNQYTIKDASGKIPIPQYKDKITGKMKKHEGNHAPYYQMVDDQGNQIGRLNPLYTQSAIAVQEQLTDTDAISGTLTFAKEFAYVEIYNTDTANNGVFEVNGIKLTVPAGKSFKAQIGGTPSAEVKVTGSTSYIITRYE